MGWADENEKPKSNKSRLTLGDLAFKNKGGKKANLPEVLDQELEGDNDAVARLLEQTLELQEEVNEATQALKDCKEELGTIAASNGLEGLRHGKVVFTQRLQDGKTSLDTEKFTQELLARGVKVEVIRECMNLATKTGDSFWVRSISTL